MEARRLGEGGRIVGADARGDRACKEIADLPTVAVDGRDEDVRRPVAVELEDQLGEVRLERMDPFCREGVVQADLVGGERLDLDHFVGAVRLRDGDRDRVRLCGGARPVHRAARSLDCRLELGQVALEVCEHVGLDAAPGLAQLLPVGQLVDDACTLGANGVGGVAEVRA